MQFEENLLDKYKNEGVTEKEIEKMFDIFSEEIHASGYELDFNDEETKTEIRRCLCEDLEFLSLVGPLNPQNLSYHNEEPCKCTPGGICGMYFCMCYEQKEKDNWYTGMCSYCEESIEDITEARRIPLHSGSFLGCFCKNPECLHAVYVENKSAVEHILIEIMNYMAKIVEKYQMEKMGNKEIIESPKSNQMFENDECIEEENKIFCNVNNSNSLKIVKKKNRKNNFI